MDSNTKFSEEQEKFESGIYFALSPCLKDIQQQYGELFHLEEIAHKRCVSLVDDEECKNEYNITDEIFSRLAKLVHYLAWCVQEIVFLQCDIAKRIELDNKDTEERKKGEL